MPNPRRARRGPALMLAAAVASSVALVATALSTPAVASPSASPSAHAPRLAVKHAKHADQHWSSAVRAKHALARTKKAFAAETPASQRPDATLALRNLWMLKDSLSPADKAEAAQFYKRPTVGRSAGCPPRRCSGETAAIGDSNILLHYDPTEVGYDVNQAFTQIQYV